jgi:hypothetical protein
MRRTALGLFLALACLPASSAAQTVEGSAVGAPEGWAFGVSGMISHWGKESDPFERWGGPALHASWVRTRGLGFDTRAGYLVPTGAYGMTGAWAQAAATWTFPMGRHAVSLEAGAAGSLAGDSDGSQWIVGGPLVGTAALLRVGPRVALRPGAFFQVLVVSGDVVTSPGATLGILLLPGRR